MKVVLLSGGGAIHTIRWANGLAEGGMDVHLVTQGGLLEPVGDGVTVYRFPDRGALGYFTMVPALKRLVRKLAPDIVNAHYASGYGTTARLLGFHPYVLSVWGSDVYEFPGRSAFHRYWVKGNLEAADVVGSTSECMADQIRTLAPGLGGIPITPFGVDLGVFGGAVTNGVSQDASDGLIVVGTVKGMAPQYGVDTLILAFARAYRELRDEGDARASRLRLRLVGDGPQTDELKRLAQQCGVGDVTTFVGRVTHEMVPKELGGLDIYVALSRLESFGVAIIEAGAAGRPVVVSDAGGLPEVTVDGETGLVVPRDNPEAAARAILKLVRDPGLRAAMGERGREHVARKYSWRACISKMEEVYGAAIERSRQQ